MAEPYKTVEQRILDAIDAIHGDWYFNCTEAAEAFEVSLRTLQRRFNGAPSKSTRPFTNKALTDVQEQAIFDYIKHLNQINMSARPCMIVRVANWLIRSEQRVVESLWVERFLKRNSQYYRRKQKSLTYDRKNSQNVITFDDHFYKYKRAMKGCDILNVNVWNMNETDFRIDCERAQLVVTLNSNKSLRMTNSNNRTYLTSMKCVSSEGWFIPLMLILAEVHILHKWDFNDLNDDTLIDISEIEYSNDDLTMNWLKHFIEHIKNKRVEAWAMLIVDEFDSHMTILFLKLCKEAKIVLYKLSPHFTHLTQPLDVDVFQSFKHYHTKAIDHAVRLSDYNFDKLEFLAAFQSFRNKTFKTSTIKHAFKQTELVSYNPEIVLEKVRANQLTRALRISSSSSLPLLHTPKESDSIIRHDRMLQKKLAKIRHYDGIDLIHMDRFIRGSMTAAHTLDITVRDLQAIQEAAASRGKRDSQLGTVAAKFEVVKVSDCRELASVRVKKEEKKAKRAEKRKKKAKLKKRPPGVATAEFLLS